MLYGMLNEIKLKNDSVWIMYNSEGNDPYFKRFITDKTVVPAVSLVNENEIILLAHSLDMDNLKDFKGKKVEYGAKSVLISAINKSLENMGMPQNIYLNYSDDVDASTDVLGHGTYKFLHDNIEKFYAGHSKNVKFHSADCIIYSLIEKKTDEDIKYMRLSAGRALQIMENVFKNIKVGMTEKDIYALFHEIFNQKPPYFDLYNIESEEFSWEKESCPIVLVGENLSKGGHTFPSDTVLTQGNTIYFDFGVKLCLKNGKKYSSDLQRMGYVLKDNEDKAPKEVQNIFDTLVEAVSLGMKNCTPDRKGYEIDSIVRNYIIHRGYPNYNHSTGHPVGETAHGPGTSIAPKGSRRSNLFLQESGVYTIEPRIQINNGGSIEEMVLVTNHGGEALCKPQKSLYTI